MDSEDADYCQDEDDLQEQSDDWGSEDEELQEVEPDASPLPASKSSSRKRKQRQGSARRPASKRTKAGPAPGGGTRSHGSNQRMWARYSEKMKTTCSKCGNTAHQAVLQPTDAEAAEFLETRCQGEPIAQVVNAWQGKYTIHTTIDTAALPAASITSKQ